MRRTGALLIGRLALLAPLATPAQSPAPLQVIVFYERAAGAR